MSPGRVSMASVQRWPGPHNITPVQVSMIHGRTGWCGFAAVSTCLYWNNIGSWWLNTDLYCLSSIHQYSHTYDQDLGSIHWTLGNLLFLMNMTLETKSLCSSVQFSLQTFGDALVMRTEDSHSPPPLLVHDVTLQCSFYVICSFSCLSLISIRPLQHL